MASTPPAVTATDRGKVGSSACFGSHSSMAPAMAK